MPGDSRLLGFAGSQLVTYSPRDGTTVIRDPDTLRAERRLPFPSTVAKLNASLGVVAFGDRDGSVRLLDLQTGRMRTAAGGHDAAVTAVAFSPDGRTLITAGRDEQLVVWDTEHATATEALQARGAGVIEGLAVAADGRTAFSAGRDGTVVAWDLHGGRRFERPLLANGKPLGGRRLVPAARRRPVRSDRPRRARSTSSTAARWASPAGSRSPVATDPKQRRSRRTARRSSSPTSRAVCSSGTRERVGRSASRSTRTAVARERSRSAVTDAGSSPAGATTSCASGTRAAARCATASSSPARWT